MRRADRPTAIRSFDPYASTTQSRNLRVIESRLDPRYRAKNDTLEFNADYNVTPALTFTSQTGYNHDFLWSTEDYNRFNTARDFVSCPGSADIPSYLGFNGRYHDSIGNVRLHGRRAAAALTLAV